MTINTLKTILISEKICLKGRMTVPRPDFAKIDVPKVDSEMNGLLAQTISPHEKDFVKNFMMENFYTNAIVPKALNLRSTWPKFEYLSDELDLMLDSKASFALIDQSKDEIIGATINTVWPVDYDAEFLDPVDPVEFLNSAADIVVKETDDQLLQIVLWRNLLFELIYLISHVSCSVLCIIKIIILGC